MPDAQPQLPTAPSPMPDLTGRVLGDYQLLRRLGSGGMGQVYLARQLSLKRHVAVKLLRDDLVTNATALKRFQAEAEAVAKLNHPNIVHIHQIGEHDGLRYMVLEYVEGRNLRDYLARRGPPDLAISLTVIRQVVLALQKAHEMGLVHRDIKPENILITRRAEVKVADFGLSRYFAGEGPATNLTQSGVTLGTPLYMAPEQVQGKPTDHRTDIYSLGVTCYHLLAGEPPFRGVTAFDVALKHVQEQPRPLADLRPDLPDDVCGMVHKMMAKDPAERYQSARDILRDIAKVREGTTVALGQTGAVATQSPSLSLGTVSAASPVASEEEGTAGSHSLGKWPWIFAGIACLAATVGGVLLFLGTHSAAEKPANPNPLPNLTSGLPDTRPVEKIVTTRERELLALLDRRGVEPSDVMRATIELGLLYVKEHRLDDAKVAFEKLEKEDFSRAPQVARTVSMVVRLGQAIVLTHRDTATAAQQANELVVKVLNDPYPRVPGKFDKPDKGAAVSTLLLRQPDLAQALAEAINRNAATLRMATLTPPQLEQLRHPPKSGKKD